MPVLFIFVLLKLKTKKPGSNFIQKYSYYTKQITFRLKSWVETSTGPSWEVYSLNLQRPSKWYNAPKTDFTIFKTYYSLYFIMMKKCQYIFRIKVAQSNRTRSVHSLELRPFDFLRKEAICQLLPWHTSNIILWFNSFIEPHHHFTMVYRDLQKTN